MSGNEDKSVNEEMPIYCVVRPELGEDIYDSLLAYYADDPAVRVIQERRRAERRSRNGEAARNQRVIRDRRRRLVPGTFRAI